MTFIEMREAAVIACAMNAVKMLPDCPEKDTCNMALLSYCPECGARVVS